MPAGVPTFAGGMPAGVPTFAGGMPASAAAYCQVSLIRLKPGFQNSKYPD